MDLNERLSVSGENVEYIDCAACLRSLQIKIYYCTFEIQCLLKRSFYSACLLQV